LERFEMAKSRVITGAHYGLKDWLAQRVTAVILAVYSLILVAFALFTKEMTYEIWSGFFASNWVKVITLLALLALIYHAWIGVRDIYMDYIKPAWIRLLLQVATILALIGYACWAVIILWRV
jgi:succinate dehydrogenase / fumarate reductase, membrane anchor subunit